jgi:hypothetical protein
LNSDRDDGVTMLARTVVFVDRKVTPFEDRHVVQPCVMAGDHVEEPYVLTVGRDRPAARVGGRVRILQKGDETTAGRVPPLAEKVEVRVPFVPVRKRDVGHALQTNEQLDPARVHIHFLDADFGRGNLSFKAVGNPDVVGAFSVPHALELVCQRESAVTRDVIDGPRERAAGSRFEIVRPADEVTAVVGEVVPENLVRITAPCQAASLLPVPGRGLADLRPLVVVL